MARRRNGGVHRGIRYALHSRPKLSENLLVYFWIDHRRYDRGTGTPHLNLACQRVERIIDELLEPPAAAATLLQDFVAGSWRDLKALAARGRLSPRTLDQKLPQLRRFLAFAHSRAVRDVQQLSPALLEDYRSWLLTEAWPTARPGRGRGPGARQGYAPSTIDQEITTLTFPLYRRAAMRGLVRRDIVLDIEPRMGPREEKVARALTRDEKARIWRAVRRQSNGRQRAKLLRFYAETGVRRDQGRFLEAAKVDLEGRVAWVMPQKRHRERPVPLAKKTVRLLASIPPNGRYIFGDVRQNAPLTWLRRACRAAGIQGYVKLHHLRDGSITRLLDAGMEIEEVAFIHGHSKLEQTRAYRHRDLRALADKLDRVR